ncbi:glycoside hydrolase family 130 protein [Sphingobacterium chuzhouense]|uniref:Glycoside hydrolase family 130 protein n=1 Tax=Sphingobacterium chuzhouense TaxID=1742264 RepID=A0ABR7XR40_9SPHI|nr:glycoside hydrolase family 130 protein [Sphingobacterium chuzhouense]MBD1421645.1 glycoside hydrolase family 130 protein [Sphingobacterium chuzhouense]
MALQVIRKNIFFRPDSKRVLARYFNLGAERATRIISRILNSTKQQKTDLFNQLLRNFSKRHRSIVSIWEKSFSYTMELLHDSPLASKTYTYQDKLLIGAYFTMEYSIEAAAFFNPSIVESPDQTQLNEGEKRVIISFRATGEGHVSSLVFRSGVIDNNMDIHMDDVGVLLEKPKSFKNYRYQREDFMEKLSQIHDPTEEMVSILMSKFTESFTYEELRRYITEIKEENQLDVENMILMDHVAWLASSHYEITFSLDTAISERVIFPILGTEKNGIEDARFVRFICDKGKCTYYATYTAYDGITILPKLLSTKDFIHFKIQPINGKIANKGAALFPRQVNGKYVLLCRVDGESNYIAFSDDLINWHQEVTLLCEPTLPLEYVQLGNCGSPIETSKGWLVLTHAVGPMREYTISALLLDLEDPTKIVGKLQRPLIFPNTEEREGYVPNVVYSCGQIVHNGYLIIPYAMSDHTSTYAIVNLNELLQELTKG